MDESRIVLTIDTTAPPSKLSRRRGWRFRLLEARFGADFIDRARTSSRIEAARIEAMAEKDHDEGVS